MSATGASPARRWLLCDCEGSQKIDGNAVVQALGAKIDPSSAAVGCSLCGTERGALAKLLEAARAEGRPIGIACAQEREIFEETLEDLAPAGPEDDPAQPPDLITADLRDRAGWSVEALGDPSLAAPKMAALLAEAMLPPAAPKTLGVVSGGVCLIVGPAETVLAAAERLAGRLSITALVTDAAGDLSALPPRPGGEAGFDIVAGRIARAAGALGGFSLTIDRFAERRPGGRGGLAFGTPRDGAETECDLILDLTGAPPLFPAAHKRDGYLRADPRDPLAVERALFDAADLVGEFDKTLHIAFEASLCAHSRARQPGCDRCLSVCPTGAITVPNGGASDHVAIDPNICAGCGACAAVCPSGAARYDAPPFERQTQRLRTLIETYRRAAPEAPGPRLLLHDAEHGGEMIRLAARHGDGLPPDVIPLALDTLNEAGHALFLAALAMGWRGVDLLAGPKTERAALQAQLALAARLLEGCGLETTRLRLLEPADPDAFAAELRAAEIAPLMRETALGLGGPRQVARQALAALAPSGTQTLDLSAPADPSQPWPAGGAPYGAVLVNAEACTLCLSCVSLCPSGALADNPDRPELRFQEDACLQCGICAEACPEDAIAYAPRFNVTPEALSWATLHSEEPFACIECGREFGVRSTIERIAEKLGGKHWMYTGSDNLKLIQMCEDCRVTAQFHGQNSPFQKGAPRKVRTTEDYLAEREATKPNGAKNGAQNGPKDDNDKNG